MEEKTTMKVNLKTGPTALSKPTKDAIRWVKGNQTEAGGFISGRSSKWFRFISGTPFLYSEITAYGMKLLLNLYRMKDESSSLMKSIRRASDFLIDIQLEDGPFLHGTSLEGEKADLAYAFDTAICVSALIDLYKEEKKEKYFQSIKKAIDWLTNEMIHDNLFLSTYNADSKRVIRNTQLWGDDSLFQFKNVICLLKAERNLNGFNLNARKFLTSLIEWQNQNGSFPVRKNRKVFFSHAHCYATETLLFAYHIYREGLLLEAVLSATEWLADIQNKNGSIPDILGKEVNLSDRIRNRFFPVEMSTADATAQALRLWYSMTKLGYEKFKVPMKKGIKYLLTIQSDKPPLDGAFYHYTKNGIELPISRTWSTLFAIHAFLIYMQKPSLIEVIKQLF